MTRAKKRVFEVVDSAQPTVIAEVLTLDDHRRVHAKSSKVTLPPPAAPAVDLSETSVFMEEQAFSSTPEAGLEGLEVVPAMRYKNSDIPLSTWRKYASGYLDEMMRLEGRGEHASAGEDVLCSGCSTGKATFRCRECHGRRLLCLACLKHGHRRLPLHVVEEWRGDRFHTVHLQSLGLRVQVGHEHPGLCPTRVPGHKDFVVLHTNGIHLVDVDFCGCAGSPEHWSQLLRASWWPATPLSPQTCATMAVLRQFHAINLQGKMSGYDFYKALQIQSNGAGVLDLPDRLPMFMLMVREWCFTLLLKRGKRGLDPTGIAGTKEGELAVRCPACPRPGVNLPSNWADAPPETAFLYWLVLAMDANFRLKSRLRSSEEKDPPLGSGLAYFVETKAYGEFVLEHTNEDEISSCVAFAALATANLKRTTGLASTGVGAVTCGRHQFWRPNGIGDLQKGERYINMDYIFLSTLADEIIRFVVASYNLACQWKKKFWRRVDAFPDHLQLDLPRANMKFLVPEFHLQAHKESCHSQHSSRKTVGMGRSELEGPERNWSWLNGAASSTKEMGPGSRRDTLDDFCGFANWRRIVGMGDFLLKKMLEAIPNAITQHHAFVEFEAGLREKRPLQLEEWEAMFEAWDADKEHKPSPFAMPRAKKSMAQLKIELKEEETAALGQAAEDAGDASGLSFLLLGLEMEQQQRLLVEDVRAARLPTTMDLSDFEDRRRALRRKLRRLRRQQRVHMPGLAQASDEGASPDAPEGVQLPKPEETQLTMPSDLALETRQAYCVAGIADMEAKLRRAEAEDALDDLRCHLRLRSFVNTFKRAQVRGQRRLTRAQHTQSRIDERVKTSKLRYRHARAALMRLTGGGEWTKTLRELCDEHVVLLNVDLIDVVGLPEAHIDHGGAGTPTNMQGPSQKTRDDSRRTQGPSQRSQARKGDGHKKVSWIWFLIPDGEDEDDNLLHEALRVEWAKSKVRAARWHEQVMHVDEEMRRVLETFATEANAWEDMSARRDALLDGDYALVEGLHAYAAEHAAMYRSLAAKFALRWAAVRSRATCILDRSAYLNTDVDDETDNQRAASAVVRVEVEIVEHDEDG